MLRTSVPLAVACALAFAAPAIARVCHPDPAGTRSLSLRGHLLSYSLSGSTVTVALRSNGACSVLVWRAGRHASPSAAPCGAVADRPSAAVDGVRLVTGDADRADRLAVGARSWALPVRARPGSVQVALGLATFTTRDRRSLWAIRLADGKTALVGPLARGDRPLLDSRGVVYRDYAIRRRPADRPLLKFVPLRALRYELVRSGRPLHTGGAIRSFSADGFRVALAVAGGAAGCDRVVVWDAPWRSVGLVSRSTGPTCSGSAVSRRISRVVLGGDRVQWVTLHRGLPMLVAANAADCIEWVIRRLSDLPRLALSGTAADGATTAFALGSRASGGSRVGYVTGAFRGLDTFRVQTAVRALSADGRRIAVLGSGGRVVVRTQSGSAVASVVSRGATSVALAGTRLATIARGTLHVYSVRTGRELLARPLPAGAAHLDLQYGIAVVTSGRSVYGVDTASGRIARLAVAPVATRAEIEPVGVVYAHSANGRGTAVLVPMSRVERAVGYSR